MRTSARQDNVSPGMVPAVAEVALGSLAWDQLRPLLRQFPRSGHLSTQPREQHD